MKTREVAERCRIAAVPVRGRVVRGLRLLEAVEGDHEEAPFWRVAFQ